MMRSRVEKIDILIWISVSNGGYDGGTGLRDRLRGYVYNIEEALLVSRCGVLHALSLGYSS